MKSMSLLALPIIGFMFIALFHLNHAQTFAPAPPPTGPSNDGDEERRVAQKSRAANDSTGSKEATVSNSTIMGLPTVTKYESTLKAIERLHFDKDERAHY